MDSTTNQTIEPKKVFNIYSKDTDKKLTSAPLTEKQVEDAKKTLTESVVIKQVLLG